MKVFANFFGFIYPYRGYILRATEAKEGGEEEHKNEIGQEADLEDQGNQNELDNNSQTNYNTPETKVNPKEYLNMHPAYYFSCLLNIFWH